MLDPLYLQQGGTHVRSSLSATRGALMYDPLYLQQEEHSCKILYICNKGSTYVRSSITTVKLVLWNDDSVNID